MEDRNQTHSEENTPNSPLGRHERFLDLNKEPGVQENFKERRKPRAKSGNENKLLAQYDETVYYY